MEAVSQVEHGAAFDAKSVTRSQRPTDCGDWRGDVREGYGVQLYRNGDKYEGSWAGDKWDGRGTQWRVGPGRALVKVYEGEFRAGQYHGLGRLYGRDGSVYEGSFTHGQRSGQGVQRLASGDTYNGEWSGDVQHGRGRLVLDNGDTFDGHFVNGKKHGPGCVAARAAAGGGRPLRTGVATSWPPPTSTRSPPLQAVPLRLQAHAVRGRVGRRRRAVRRHAAR